MDDSKKNASPKPQELQTIQPDRQYRVIRFSPDGQSLFAASYDADIHRWDFSGDTPQVIEPLKGHHGWVESLIFAPAHDLLISTDSWGELRAWNCKDDSPQPRWRRQQAHDGWIRAAALSADQSLIATAGRDRTVRVWSTTDGKLLHELRGHEHEVFSVAVHPNNQAVLSGDLFGNIKHWQLEGGKIAQEIRLEKMHYYDRDQDVAGLYSLRFHEDGATLWAAGNEPNRAGRVGGPPTIYHLTWDSLETQKTLKIGENADAQVFDYELHPDGYLMLVTSGRPGKGEFLCQRLGEDKPFYLTNRLSNCHSLAFDAGSNRVVVASTNKRSQGNGAVRDDEGNYVGNTSPLTVFALPDA